MSEALAAVALFLLVLLVAGVARIARGPTQADRRRAERRAKEINLEIRNGRLGLTKREKPVPFDAFARQWYEDEILAPAERELEGAVRPKTFRSKIGKKRSM